MFLYQTFYFIKNQRFIQESVAIHIGSGNSLIIDDALAMLRDISINFPSVIISSPSTITGILEYIDQMEESQIRTLYQIVARIAYEPNVEVKFPI